MKTRFVAAPCAALVLSLPAVAHAAERLTLEAALDLARQRSPLIAAARGRVAESDARLHTRPALRDNPEIDAARGSRTGAPTSDFEVSISQRLELGGRGQARRAIEVAGLTRDTAERDEIERSVLRDVRLAFVRGLHARERMRLAQSVERDAGELQRVAERRRASGDIADLEVNVAASAFARARADVRGAEATQASADGDLRTLLDMAPTESLALVGELTDHRSYDPNQLLAALDRRPEIRALEAQLKEAEGEVKLGAGLAWPEITPAARYERDQGDRVLWAGVRISLPMFDRGQQVRATGHARASRLRSEIDARQRSLRNRLHTALAVHDLRLVAMQELSANAARVTESETLVRRSYEVGQIGLAELLLLKREHVESRREYLDSLLELAQIGAELDALAGGSR